MGKFNLNDYDQVEDRIKKFYDKNKDGRITTRVIFQDGERTMIKAYVYLNRQDQLEKCPKATGIAEEERVDKQKTSTGKVYEPVNFSSWTENCETSAIGRALANMDMSGNKRPSRQEMEKVQRYSKRGKQTLGSNSGPSRGKSDGTPAMTKKQEDYVKVKIEEVFGIKNNKELPRLEKVLGYKIDDMNMNEASNMLKKLLEPEYSEWRDKIRQNLAGPLD